VAEQLVRVTLASVKDDEAVLRADVEQSTAAIAERVARGLVEQANISAAEERALATAAAEEKLQATLDSANSAAEEVARRSLDSAKASMEEASRAVLESARAELQESVRSVAEVASKPAAEAAARAVAEELMREALKVAREDEVASRQRVEENAIAVAERVGRELVKMAFSASKISRPEAEASEGERVGATSLVSSAPQVTEPPPAPQRSAWAMPWLAGLTLAVLYLLYRTFA
jgi:hypothetical protein